MIVTFCGHRNVIHRERVETWLRFLTGELIKKGAATFYVGGYGEFDSMAVQILREQKRIYSQIEIVLVLAYPPSKGDFLGYDSTVYPPLETVPRRYAITYRNRWMVDASEVVVGYVLHDGGGAAATLKYAKQKKKKIITFNPERE